ncbi:MAG: tyrosine-type recombinase/integrase [Serratia symbiotica]|nr:tyrosine-type recombinase/integrase [Serratia symbiotica]
MPNSDVLFLAKDGIAGLTANSITNVVVPYIRDAGTDKGSYHLFRHVMVTQMLENGADLRWIQAMLNHRSVESTHKSASGSPCQYASCGAAGGWVSEGYGGKVMIRYILCHYSGRSEERIMPKEAVFTMKLENSLREGFIAAAKASHRPASQVMRELMREYIQRQNDRQAYDDWVVQKIKRGRQSIRSGEGTSNEDVKALFVERRTTLAGKM